MFHIRHITDFDAPELKPYLTMRRQLEHRQQGIFVAEGEKVVRRLLASRFGVVSLLVPEKWALELQPLLEARPENIPVFIGAKPLLEKLTGFSMYQGLLAVGRVPGENSLADVLASTPRPHLFVAVDSLSSAENLGAVVRNSAAFNVQALVVGETCTSPFLRRAVRSSMGSIFDIPVVESSSLVNSLRELRQSGMRCVAAHPHVQGCTLGQTELCGDLCLVLGSEGYGIAPQVLEACDTAVAIPMPPKVDSLNVGSAAAVFLYEISRQRGLM